MESEAADSVTERRERLGGRIKSLREKRGLTKRDLASRAGISDVAVGYHESGEIAQIGHERLMGLAGGLGVAVSELVGDPEWVTEQARIREEGMLQGAVMAVSMLASGDGTTLKEVLMAFGVRNSEDLAGCDVGDIKRLAAAGLGIPGLDEARK